MRRVSREVAARRALAGGGDVIKVDTPVKVDTPDVKVDTPDETAGLGVEWGRTDGVTGDASSSSSSMGDARKGDASTPHAQHGGERREEGHSGGGGEKYEAHSGSLLATVLSTWDADKDGMLSVLEVDALLAAHSLQRGPSSSSS